MESKLKRLERGFSKTQCLSLGVLVFYGLVRYIFIDYLDQLGAYAAYIFETGFCGILLVVFWERATFKIKPSMRITADMAATLIAGYSIYKIASPLELVIPFDLKAIETVILLLVVAPILEEMIFRMAIWELLSELYPGRMLLLLMTSAMFSFSHFFAWWNVPVELHPFVLYQTLYTFGLALYCGIRRIQTKSISVPIGAHLFFNVGFYLGFLL